MSGEGDGGRGIRVSFRGRGGAGEDWLVGARGDSALMVSARIFGCNNHVPASSWKNVFSACSLMLWDIGSDGRGCMLNMASSWRPAAVKSRPTVVMDCCTNGPMAKDKTITVMESRAGGLHRAAVGMRSNALQMPRLPWSKACNVRNGRLDGDEDQSQAHFS